VGREIFWEKLSGKICPGNVQGECPTLSPGIGSEQRCKHPPLQAFLHSRYSKRSLIGGTRKNIFAGFDLTNLGILTHESPRYACHYRRYQRLTAALK